MIDFSHTEAEIPKGIFITEMNVNQNAKWAELDRNIEMNFRLIDEAIVRGDKVIILPETAFTLRLNQSGREYLMERLLDLSHHITIITGGQRGEYDFSNSDYIRATATYNTTFVFEKGQWNYADKILSRFLGLILCADLIKVEVCKMTWRRSFLALERRFAMKQQRAKHLMATQRLWLQSAIARGLPQVSNLCYK